MILRARTRESYLVLVRTVTTNPSQTNATKTVRATRAKEKTGPRPKSLADPITKNLVSNLNKKKEIYIKTADLIKVREAQKLAAIKSDKRRAINSTALNSYLSVCVDIGQTPKALSLLLFHGKPRKQYGPDVKHYNTVMRGFAIKGDISQIVEIRMNMIKNKVEPNIETYAYIILAYCNSSSDKRKNISKVLVGMNSKEFDSKKIFQHAYLNRKQREIIKSYLKTHDPSYNDIFCEEPSNYDCKLLENLKKLDDSPHDIAKSDDLSDIELWAEQQRSLEWKSSIAIKSIAKVVDSKEYITKYSRQWRLHHDMWRKTLAKSLDEYMKALQSQFLKTDKIHLYPYLCSIDRNLLINLMLDEVETNAVLSKYSMSTYSLHSILGSKVMIRYLRAKAVADGSHSEQQTIYNKYVSDYCRNPRLMGRLNSREYIQHQAAKMKNYAVYRDMISPIDPWPSYIISSVGRFLYGILLREVKFDPEVLKNPDIKIDPERLVHAFYTAYFQIENTHKIKEEFRSHEAFDSFQRKASCVTLRFDYSYLPTSSPPMPWLSPSFGGYLTNKSELVRLSAPHTEPIEMNKDDKSINQKLYPSLDSLNVLGLCPWIVNKEILDLVIDLFQAGGDADLAVPLDETKMSTTAPTLKGDSKANRILYNKEKKKYDQKRREMYSLWRDCLYRLSIANHFRNRVIWFPHNMDFRGRVYPIPPHFNHLGADLARSLLLFAKGKALGDKGLDWLKIHLINLTGTMKRAPLYERLEYANSILHLEVLDSADNPWDGRRWWAKNENPWQVLACCKEIAKAIRCQDSTQYISHFPVHQDGSCNGLQHYAALGRDPEGAKAVNLVPCDKPQDVYSRVVELVEEARKKDAEEGIKVAANLEGFVQRKVIKQTVMTTVYGVTRYGARHQIARQLAAKGYPDSEIWATSQYLVNSTFKSIGQMFTKSQSIQDWFTQCASIIANKYKQPVSWETPLGFFVQQPYRKLNKTTTSCMDSPSVWFDKPSFYDPLAQLNVSKQKTAFPPNYIHSLDSSHMMLTSLYCRKQGLTFVSVHDCYWTHPSSVDQMNVICRQQFVAMHSEPLLKILSDHFIALYENGQLKNHPDENPDIFAPQEGEETWEPKLKEGSAFAEVPTQGDLDLNVVLNSIYFFS